MKYFLVIFLMISSLAFSDDKGNYDMSGGVGSFLKAREVSDEIEQFTLVTSSVAGTNTFINFKRNTQSITIANDSGSTVYVNFNGSTSFNVTGTTGYTTSGSAIINFNNSNAQYLQVNSNIFLNEGDANDGAYTIIGTDNPNFTLDRALTVTHSGNQDFKFSASPIFATEKLAFGVATNVMSIISAGASSSLRIYVSYQKGS